MKILIVEDDEHKSSQIVDLINMESTEFELTIVDNVSSAVSFLKDIIPDKIILDMSLPSHKALPGQGAPAPLPTGGIEVLFELKKRKLEQMPILILTQYHEIEIEGEPYPVEYSAQAFKDEYGFRAIDACYYDNVDQMIWESRTIEFLRS